MEGHLALDSTAAEVGQCRVDTPGTREVRDTPSGQHLMSKESERKERRGMSATPPTATPARSTESKRPAAEPPDAKTERSAAGAARPAKATDYAAEELRTISRDLAAEFPIPIETTELVLMDVDPHHVHAYWNITPADLAAARTNADHRVDESALVLRLNDLSPGPPAGAPRHEPVDIPVNGMENHWHLTLWQDAKSYMAELGLRLPDGRLVLLARSNSIEMPQAGQSARQPVPPADESTHGPPAQSRLSATAPAAAGIPDPTLGEAITSPLTPMFPNIDGSGVSAPGLGAGMDDIPVLPAIPGEAAASTPSVRAHGPVLTGAPTRLPTGTGTGTVLNPETYSSSTLSRGPGLEINAELHIYGRGAPGDQIQLFGRQVTLDSEGRFSLRRPLSDPLAVVSLLAAMPGDAGTQGGHG